ncbi:uncharacterized protein LOC132747877 [Ruditapes philippinarum]|uniref:uncharacterized protein LOC132747877 n=1 Tax=Ruditapes philippinarum TaxID=129788 RepID=UPI00295BF13A|nr:uncharacterized protein LOC132747877 [Ruditapes philippinarum]
MATCHHAEEGEITSENDRFSDEPHDENMASPTRGDLSSRNDTVSYVSAGENTANKLLLTKDKGKKKSLSKKYDELSNRMCNMEKMLQTFLDKQSGEKNEQTVTNQLNDDTNGQRKKSNSKGNRDKFLFDSSEDDSDSDMLSIFAGGQISPAHENNDSAMLDKNNNREENVENLSENTRKCLFEMFGEDAVVKKVEQKKGLTLDKSQIEVIDSGYRCKQPNFLSAFAEENFDLFPVDADAEKLLEVPSLDDMVEVCLTKRYGPRASFAKGKQLYTQPAKMMEKVAYKGQQAARLGLVIQMYIQQSLGNLLQMLNSTDFERDQASQMVKDIFAMSTKCLDQIGRTGAFHHIVRRSCCMKDTGLHEQTDKWDYYNLPLSGDGVFGKELETLLKDKKEKRKQVDDLIPDLNKKRKLSASGNFSEYKKKQPIEKLTEKPSTSSYGLNNFRIPKISRSDSRGKFRGRGYSYGTRRPPSGRGKPVAKTDEK